MKMIPKIKKLVLLLAVLFSPALIAASLGDMELRGQQALKAGNLQQAKRTFYYLAKKNPDNPEYHVQLAKILYALDDELGGDEAIGKALAVKGNHLPTLLLYAKRLLQSEDLMGAMAAYELVLEQDNEQVEALQRLSGVWEIVGNLGKADHYRKRYVSIMSNN